MGEYLVVPNSFYGCGKGGQIVKECPNVRSQGKGNGQAQPSHPSFEAQKSNHFYALKARVEYENSPNVVTGMLQVFFVNVYALLDLCATLSFVTHLVDRKFDVLSNLLVEPFSVCTLMGDSVVAKTVYRKCLVMLPSRVTLVDLVEMDMLDFDVILGMD
ncbi:uncharacterized protein [Solanum lycopersicum]|uniref:uncharacterized protein n=1 Tax=Solanum lycopersicum TaxID=4081 RepID=UPI0037483BA1